MTVSGPKSQFSAGGRGPRGHRRDETFGQLTPRLPHLGEMLGNAALLRLLERVAGGSRRRDPRLRQSSSSAFCTQARYIVSISQRWDICCSTPLALAGRRALGVFV